ncbi:2-oxoglutarate (2OG) and Fe(II)-dependent oxygenase superfamily protein [Striga asiatica]|uniref:2-oxoglutarate (2OG) and Fe(II)-dependent oxygenase superfamily protein n=1 Tax=Striga asiatica TaxID=4170 RepID=A0A5A7P352_STRAF|nr:2-oxoglutarate (2OG) and Fe(II)-dependent oxygenase superfamily protein [Striga asiatica]
MSKIIHKLEEKIKEKVEKKLHLGHKEDGGKHHEDEKENPQEEYSSGHLKEFMHKMKGKMGNGRRHYKFGQAYNEGEEDEGEGEGELELEEEEFEGEEEGGFEFEIDFDF